MKICSVCNRCFDDTAAACVDADHPPLSISRKGGPLMVPGYALERLHRSAAKVDVYLAQRSDCGRNCLVRIISADAQNREAFLRDARVAAMVFDPRMADIFESGNLPSGEYFVVEEDVQGQTSLRQHLAEVGVPELLTSIRIVEQIAETLHVLHTSGLTHGAVRPENIVIEYAADGLPIVKLSNIDLGSVIARNTVANKFLIDSAIDAIRYFAPEQCSGQALSPQTDVYSLGAVFYELLAGIPPFDAPKATALIEMHRSHRPPEIKIDDFELRMLVTHGLSESLQKQPSFRQSSADLFARQMRHIEQLATHVSTPPPAVGAPTAPSRITPSPTAFSSAPIYDPAPEAEMLKDCPQFDDALAEPVHALKAAPIEIAEFVYAVDDEPIWAPEVECQSAPEPAEIDPEEADDIEDLFLPQISGGNPLPERSSLVERRHCLKLWMKQTRPQLPVNNEVTANVLPSVTSELFEEPPAAPEVTAFETGVLEEIYAEPDVKPKLIEWEQPDDVPSLDEIEMDPSIEFESAQSAHILSVHDEIPVERTAARPHLIEWEQPEDDIPSIEDVIEARRDEEAAVIRAIQFKPEDSVVAAVVQERIEAETNVPVTTQLAAPQNDVRAVETITFDFVPTLLSDKKDRTRPEPQENYLSILAAYEPADSPARAFPYRSLFIGLGLMTIAAILGLGGDPLWRYFSEPQAGEPVATAAVPMPQSPLPARSDRSIGDEAPPHDSEPPSTFNNSGPAYETAEQVTPERNTAASAPKPRKAVQTSPPASTPPSPGDSTPFSPSTVVITYGSGNVRRTDSSKGRSEESSPRPSDPNRSGATRPRVVQVPPDR